MFEAVKNKITELERLTFGPLIKDENLKRGEWRYLSEEEVAMLENTFKK
jgi:16S rRNA pseudouridine516 synthase